MQNKLNFFDEILKIKENYTDEQKFDDMKKHEMLMQLAQDESDCVGDDRINRRI
jgi:hypothetical protein